MSDDAEYDEDQEYVYSEDEDIEMSDADEVAAQMRAAQEGTSAGGSVANAASSASSSSAAASPAAPAYASSSSGGAGARGRMSVGASADFRMLTAGELEAEQAHIVDDVCGVLDVRPGAGALLLSHYNWNREKLLEAFTTDPASVTAAVGLTHYGKEGKPAGSEFFCNICLTDTPSGNGFQLGCGHPFCNPCWKEYLTEKSNEQGSVSTRCPESDCGEAVTLAVVKQLAPPDAVEKWVRFNDLNFVNVAKNMAWCPGNNCGRAFMALRGALRSISCACGSKFCFKCAHEAHDPASCAKTKTWDDKCRSESETVTWMIANTKPCPKCSVRIEKNSGCNHMSCRNKGCKHEFCWVCTGPWSEHGSSTGGYYNCNKFNGKEPGAGASDAARAKAENERYIWYYSRYENHDKSGRFAAKHRQEVQRRMGELQEAGGLAYSDVTFLNDATEALLECHRVLKYTYVYGYYLPDGQEKKLFEYLQEKLERSTDQLAELTEAPVDRMDRTEVVNFTRVTQSFLRNLLEGLEEGLTSGA